MKRLEAQLRAEGISPPSLTADDQKPTVSARYLKPDFVRKTPKITDRYIVYSLKRQEEDLSCPDSDPRRHVVQLKQFNNEGTKKYNVVKS